MKYTVKEDQVIKFTDEFGDESRVVAFAGSTVVFSSTPEPNSIQYFMGIFGDNPQDYKERIKPFQDAWDLEIAFKEFYNEKV